METRICITCKKEKPLKDFDSHKYYITNIPDYKKSCYDCMVKNRKYSKERRERKDREYWEKRYEEHKKFIMDNEHVMDYLSSKFRLKRETLYVNKEIIFSTKAYLELKKLIKTLQNEKRD